MAPADDTANNNKRGRMDISVSPPAAAAASSSSSGDGGYGDFVDNLGDGDGVVGVDTKDDLPDLPPALLLSRQATYIMDGNPSSTSPSSSSTAAAAAGSHHTRTPPQVRLLGAPRPVVSLVNSPSAQLATGLGTLKVSTPTPAAASSLSAPTTPVLAAASSSSTGDEYKASTPATWVSDITTRFHLQVPPDLLAFWNAIKHVCAKSFLLSIIVDELICYFGVMIHS